jgi:hypothetical protein
MVLPRKETDSRKTVLKTMRIPNYINTLLEKDADSKGVSVNTLISMIMTKYAEWDRYIDVEEPNKNSQGTLKQAHCLHMVYRD